MTLGGLISRFFVTYVLALACGFLLAVCFVQSSTLVITTAALAASTLYVCQSFRRRSGRRLDRREIALVWAALLTIDIFLQSLTRLAAVGMATTGLARFRQFVAGDLVLLAVLHGVCILAFIVMAGRIEGKREKTT